MASGTIYGSTSNQYIDSKIVWTSAKNDSANTSSVTAKLYYKRNNSGYETEGTGSFTISIGGQTYTESMHITITERDWVLAASVQRTVSHNSDGTKSITISATGSIPGTSLTSTSCSGRATLDTILRASTLTFASDRSLGNTCIIKWTPLSKSFRYKLAFTLNSFSYTTEAIHPNTTSVYTYTGYTLSIEDIAPYITTNPPKATMTVTLYTYSDIDAKTQIGSTSQKTFVVTVPDNETTKPNVAMSLEAVSALGSTFSGLYIQGKSRTKASFSGSSGKYGATISSYGMTVLGKGYASPFQTEHLSQSGTVTVYGRARDSRGFVKEITKDIYVIPYSKPKLVPKSGSNSIICARCDSDGKLTDSGTYLKIAVGRSYYKVMSGSTQKNKCLLRYRYKTSSASNFSSYVTLLSKDSTNDSIDTTIGGIVTSVTTSYVVELSVIDDIGESATITFVIPTEDITFHLREGGDGAAFGKYAERQKALDIASDWDMYFKGDKIEKKFFSLRGHTKIPSGADLNDYRTPDVYAIEADAHAANIANMPPFKRSGILIVYAGTGQDSVVEGTWKYIVQEYRCLYSTIPTYRRTINSNGDGVWSFETWQMEKGLDTGWVELTMSGNASAPSTVARGGAGCFYRAINENHIFVRFNCAFTFNGSSINLNSAPIPSQYRPKNNAYGLFPVNDRGIARASVASDGYIYINYVQNMATASTTTSFTATWIDGYIDYWL